MKRRAVKKFIRRHFRDATDEFISFLMWEKTAFPFCTWKHSQQQIVDYACALTLWPKTRLCDSCNLPLNPDEKWYCASCIPVTPEAEAE